MQSNHAFGVLCGNMSKLLGAEGRICVSRVEKGIELDQVAIRVTETLSCNNI